MEKKEPIYYLNGKFVPKSKAKISVWDLGLLRGYGVFDYIVTYNNGRPFLLNKHLKRLQNSARLIGLKMPYKLAQLKTLVLKTVQKNNNGKEKVIRIVLTGGESKDAISLGIKPTLAIIVYDRNFYPALSYKNGINVITFDHNREAPQAKSLNYIQAVKAMSLTKKKKATEAIYIFKKLDKVYEGTQSNLFLIKGGEITTPDGETLPGITRELVMKMCMKILPTLMREVKIQELFNADEIFITASNKEIIPVVKVDKTIIGNGKPGPITKKLIEEYRKFVEAGNW